MFSHYSNPFGPLINGLNYLRIRFLNLITKFENSMVLVTPGSQSFRLNKPTFYHSNLVFYDRCVHPERISHDCPFKSSERDTKILILTPCRRGRLCKVMHTVEIDLAVGCTLGSKKKKKKKNLEPLTPWYDAHLGV